MTTEDSAPWSWLVGWLVGWLVNPKFILAYGDLFRHMFTHKTLTVIRIIGPM